MIKRINELEASKEHSFNRTFQVETKTGYGLSTVIAFIKYQIGTSNIKVTPQKEFSNEEYYIFSVHDKSGSQVATVACYCNKNQFNIAYNQGALFASGFTINKII